MFKIYCICVLACAYKMYNMHNNVCVEFNRFFFFFHFVFQNAGDGRQDWQHGRSAMDRLVDHDHVFCEYIHLHHNVNTPKVVYTCTCYTVRLSLIPRVFGNQDVGLNLKLSSVFFLYTRSSDFNWNGQDCRYKIKIKWINLFTSLFLTAPVLFALKIRSAYWNLGTAVYFEYYFRLLSF